MAYEIRTGSHAELGEYADSIKQRVFVEEQGIPAVVIFEDADEQPSDHLIDDVAQQFVMFDGEQPVATVRCWQDEQLGWRIGMIAVLKERRGEQLGRQVVECAIEYILSHGGDRITVSAQTRASGFYKKLGFVVVGEPVLYPTCAIVRMQLDKSGR